MGASIPRNTDSGTYIHVGPEIGVASTKAFTGQVTVLMLLALCVGQMRGTVDDATVERIACRFFTLCGLWTSHWCISGSS